MKYFYLSPGLQILIGGQQQSVEFHSGFAHVKCALSALERASISSIRRLMRFPSRAIVWEKRSASVGEACFMAERAESMTVSGERSSWEAEAINSVCFLRFSIKGRIMRQVKSQKKTGKENDSSEYLRRQKTIAGQKLSVVILPGNEGMAMFNTPPFWGA